MWSCELAMAPQADPVWQQIEAWFHRLDGQAGNIRIGDPWRREPYINRLQAASTATFSDGTSFSDGTGFAEGYLPPFCTAYAAASKGASFITLAGLPASLSAAVTRGDPFEIRPNGIAAEFPHFYQFMHDNGTDSQGRAGVEIRPRLRAGIAAGDMIVLKDATCVMHIADDSQGRATVGLPRIGALSFSLIEALDLVP
jgi:hypothetical protein